VSATRDSGLKMFHEIIKTLVTTLPRTFKYVASTLQ
jgi:hypothetical protein